MLCNVHRTHKRTRVKHLSLSKLVCEICSWNNRVSVKYYLNAIIKLYLLLNCVKTKNKSNYSKELIILNNFYFI
jgi:hypothetical protein